MDTLLFGSNQKPTANTLDERGFGNTPAIKQRQYKASGTTSLFGKEDDPGMKASVKKSTTVNKNGQQATGVGLFGSQNDGGFGFGSNKRQTGAITQRSVSPFANDLNNDIVASDDKPKVRGAQPKAQFEIAIPEKFEKLDPTAPKVLINAKSKKINNQSRSSMGMTRLLDDENTRSGPKSSRFISNSGAQMSSLADLDRKSKHATMRTQSNVFSQTMPASLNGANKNVDNMKRKGGAGSGTKGAMGSIMTHNEGPYSKLDWPSKKGAVTDKTTSQNTKQVKRQTFIKVMTEKKEPTNIARANMLKSQVF